jgi:hypothetical protein
LKRLRREEARQQRSWLLAQNDLGQGLAMTSAMPFINVAFTPTFKRIGHSASFRDLAALPMQQNCDG